MGERTEDGGRVGGVSRKLGVREGHVAPSGRHRSTREMVVSSRDEVPERDGVGTGMGRSGGEDE